MSFLQILRSYTFLLKPLVFMCTEGLSPKYKEGRQPPEPPWFLYHCYAVSVIEHFCMYYEITVISYTHRCLKMRKPVMSLRLT